jgi:hypothetical protein
MRRSGDRDQRVFLRGRHCRDSAITAFLLVLLLSIVGAETQGQELAVSGQFGLDTVAVPIPATLVSEIQLDSPGKLTVFKFGIESLLDLHVDYGDFSTRLNSLISVAGLERCILVAYVPLGPILFKPEMLFAAPFETVTDINHFTNWVAIPPGGDLMFVTARLTVSGSFAGLDIRNLLMIQDVTFPNPGADFVPLQYPVQSQSFHVGNILTVCAEVYPGVTLRSVVNFFANSSSTSVIGWSGQGSVDKESSLCDDFGFSGTLTLTGLQYCGVGIWVSLAVDPCDPEPVVLTGGGTIRGLWDLDITGSFSLFPLSISGFSFSTSICDVIDASFQLSDTFHFESASLRARGTFDTGLMKANVYSSCSFTNGEGFTSLTLGSRLTHGTISGALVGCITKQQESYRLTSVSPSLSFNFSPLAFSVSARFGRSGLVQGLMSLRLVF